MNAHTKHPYCWVCRTGFSGAFETYLAHDCTDHVERAQFETRFVVLLALLVVLSVGIVALCGGAL